MYTVWGQSLGSARNLLHPPELLAEEKLGLS